MKVDSTWTSQVYEAFDFRSSSRALIYGIKALKGPFRMVEIEVDGLSRETPLKVDTWRISPEYTPQKLPLKYSIKGRELFSEFSKIIGDIPVKVVLDALSLPREGHDMNYDSLSVEEEAFSILCFRQFVKMVKQGKETRCFSPLPSEHVEFYKETIVRLIDAHELPPSTMQEFDHTFGLEPSPLVESRNGFD